MPQISVCLLFRIDLRIIDCPAGKTVIIGEFFLSCLRKNVKYKPAFLTLAYPAIPPPKDSPMIFIFVQILYFLSIWLLPQSLHAVFISNSLLPVPCFHFSLPSGFLQPVFLIKHIQHITVFFHNPPSYLFFLQPCQ